LIPKSIICQTLSLNLDTSTKKFIFAIFRTCTFPIYRISYQIGNFHKWELVTQDDTSEEFKGINVQGEIIVGKEYFQNQQISDTR